jgi:hypothetical protein
MSRDVETLGCVMQAIAIVALIAFVLGVYVL